jgi:hypothetical protein
VAEVWEIVNPRQLAVVIWTAIVVVAVFAILVKDERGRGSLWSFIQTASSPKVVFPVVLIVGWNAITVWFLYRVGYWDFSMLVDTVVLAVGASVASLFRATTATFNRRFFLKTTGATLGLTVIAHFLINMYPFSFLVEMFLVPVAGFVVLLRSFAEGKVEYRPVYRLFLVLDVSLGIGLFLRSVIMAILDSRNFASFATLRTAMLPFVMTALFFPLLFALCTWITYETAFLPLKLGVQKSRRFVFDAKWTIARAYGLNLPRLQMFSRSKAHNALRSAADRESLETVLGLRESA